MMNGRNLLITATAAVALACFAWLGYLLYNRVQRESVSPFTAIPGNTALIIHLKKAGTLMEELNRSNLLWRSLARFPGISGVRKELQDVDSAIGRHAEMNRLFRQHDILVAITLSGRTNFGALYLTEVSGGLSESGMVGFIREASTGKAILSESPYAATTLYRVQSGGNREAFYFAILKGVFMGSFHADLVKRGIDRLSLNTPMAASSGFRKIQATAGKKVDANIYVNYRFFSLVLSRIMREDYLPDLMKLSDFADWTGLDLIIKKDELLFNGLTVATDSNMQFLAMFEDQKPQKKEVVAIIPDRAFTFTSFGWSDPARFCQRVQARSQREETFTGEQNEVLSIIDRYQLNVSEYFVPWIGNEGALFSVEDPVTGTDRKVIAFRVRDTASAATSLFGLADTLGLRYDSVKLKGSKIFRLPLPAFLPYLFGDLFSRTKAECFTFLHGYILFAASPSDLEPVIEAVADGLTLEKNRAYRDFDANLSDKANVYCYFSANRGIRTIRESLKQELYAQVTPMLDSLRRFESVGFQYGNMDGLFYSDVFLRFDPNIGREGPLQWQAALDTTMTGQPWIVNTTKHGDRAVIVTDVLNNLYLVAPDGHIEWKMRLMGALKGDIRTLKVGPGDSLAILFNTDTHLYMLWPDGKYADRFPMRFPLHATNGISVADWDSNGQYNLYVAFQDNHLYNFTLDGVSVPGWKRPLMTDMVSAPATCFSIREKDCIFVSDTLGNTRVFDRNGAPAISPGTKFTHAPSSEFYLNRSNKKGSFLTTGPDGKVIFINGNGRISAVTLNFFTPAHRFFYGDITGNGQPEFIYSDKNNIYYYNRNFKLVYSYAFRREMTSPPFLAGSPDGKCMIGYVAPESNELFLFDRNGFRDLGSGVHGNTPFRIGFLETPSHYNLVVGSGRFLKNYRLPKF